MSDYSELKRLAEAARSDNSGYGDADCYEPKFGLTVVETAFASAATPAAVLALIAENEDARRTGAFWKDEKICADAVIVQLKAENDRLRKDADRYRWLRDEADFSDFEALCHVAIDGWAAYIDGCETCQGSGEIDQTLGGEWNSGVVPCPDCDGRGR